MEFMVEKTWEYLQQLQEQGCGIVAGWRSFHKDRQYETIITDFHTSFQLEKYEMIHLFAMIDTTVLL